jgi:hypothetical protein
MAGGLAARMVRDTVTVSSVAGGMPTYKKRKYICKTSAAEPHHLHAAAAPGKNFDEALAPTLPLPVLYS